jgi:hypothetical protein
MATAPHSIFISYRHDAPWTGLSNKLYLKLRASTPSSTEVFFDANIPPGAEWAKQVKAALDRCTHFVAMLCDEYWVLSTECRKELEAAVTRHHQGGAPRLLFVQAGSIRPELMQLDANAGTGALGDVGGGLENLGQINFLGPFDANARLTTLASDRRRLDLQLAQLRDRLLQA